MTYKKEKTQYTGDWKNDKKEGEGILAKFINNTYKEMIESIQQCFLPKSGFYFRTFTFGLNDGNHIKGVYSGHWKNDQRSGNGVNFYHDQ